MIKGIGASSGIGIAKALKIKETIFNIKNTKITDIEFELDLLNND